MPPAIRGYTIHSTTQNNSSSGLQTIAMLDFIEMMRRCLRRTATLQSAGRPYALRNKQSTLQAGTFLTNADSVTRYRHLDQTCKVQPGHGGGCAVQQAAAGGQEGAHRQNHRHIVAALHFIQLTTSVPQNIILHICSPLATIGFDAMRNISPKWTRDPHLDDIIGVLNSLTRLRV